MNPNIRVGVVGVGHLGRHHARNYAALNCVELIGVHDTNPEQNREIAAANQTRSFFALDEMLDAIDAVSVATPTKSHFQIVKQALEANCHVIVEKPMTTTVEEADELIELAAGRNKVLQVGHIERFNGAILAIQDQIKAPMFIECHRLAPFNPRGTDVSVILDLTIHDIDIVMSFVNDRVA